ncbi:hypothetical protein E4633_18705 [Geomonas terrae]|uniref:Carboxypeptidase regulatory-like domain-containing protein n=1 Tax=Geomonas terrae TaxID=2562681 RepID=A0A4S1CAB4_9BACT|nr:hypothetical protein [Geomonas terrae]TGU70231.1 hypothetical protein E4633_18705 [Geomonas terrae]
MKIWKGLFVAALLMLTAACGGGGGGSKSTTVTGVAAAGVIKGGTVKVFAPYSSATEADKKQIGATATTDATTGRYTVNLGSYTGPVIVEVFGSYTDEATNQTATIPSTAPLRAMAVTTSGTVDIAVTPLTELAARQAVTLSGGPGKKVTAANIGTANAQVSDLFKVKDIIATQPLDAGAPLAGTADQKNYTLVLAALSQVGNDPTKLATTLNTVAAGINTSGVMTDAVATSITDALDAFVTNTNNKTGITATTMPGELADIGATTVTLTMALTGTGVKSVQTDITLPANVSVETDNTGAFASGVLTNLIGGTNVSLVGSELTASSVRVIFNRADATPMPAGDIATVKFMVAPGVAVPAATAFTTANTMLKDANGAVVTGANLTLVKR